ncbi:GDSL esterase/lipase [Spatholobus suberectus]|nr:GDSL esterase/lipase [Spatholobus suberectus]
MSLAWLLLFTQVLAVTNSEAEHNIPAVIVFGDSSVDSGNNNVIATVLKSNFKPYGRDFEGGRPTGRFCNGRVPPDFIAEALGIKRTIPAYLDPAYTIQDFATGVCFASAGTGYDNATAAVLNVIPLWKELEMYKEYQAKLRAHLGVEKANEIIGEALYLMSLGTNDFLENYYVFPTRQVHFTVSRYQDFLLGIAENFIRELYALGARKLVVTGLVAVGCLPLERVTNILGHHGCNEEYNNVALSFNKKLDNLMTKLNRELPQLKAAPGNAYPIFNDIIRRPSAYGFEVVEKACCSTGTFEMSYLCSDKNPLTCTDADKYVFWDAFHPTEKTNRIHTPKSPYTKTQTMEGHGKITLLLCLHIVVHLLSLVATTGAKVPAVIVFGDSSVDAGNNNFIPTIARSNFQPYGRDFAGGKATGRFCNGRIPTDFISEAFGLKHYVPAYLDPKYNISDFATGVTFASAATGYDNATSAVLSVIPLWKQLEYYKGYQKNLSAYLGESKAKETIAEALHIMSLGTNDFLENYYTMPGRASQFTPQQYQTFLAGIAENCIRSLYGLGARKISLGGLPPMGCLPLERTTNIAGGNDCVDRYNNLALEFNDRLKNLTIKLNQELPGIKLVFSNPYYIMLNIIRRPELYGFESTSVACCATGMFEMGYACSRGQMFSCSDASKYVFWDSFHPTEKTNSIVAKYVVLRVLYKFLQ